MAVELGKKVERKIVKANELKDGQIAEIVSGGYIGRVVQMGNKELFAIGLTECNGFYSNFDEEVRILEVGETITITANDGI